MRASLPEGSGVIFGLDYGLRKIGVAVGQTITATASTLPVLKARNGVPDWDELNELLRQWQPAILVIGMPYNMDGSENEMTAKTLAFIAELERRFAIPCEAMDERLSTREARRIDRANAALQGRSYDDKSQVDSLAAQLILESWLAEKG